MPLSTLFSRANTIRNQQAESQQETTQKAVSIADELSKLAKLKEQGVITEDKSG
jgi:hypothetical protein